jgi:uncharacterized protein
MRRVLVAGASGLVGRHLISALLEQDCKPCVLSRNPERSPLEVGIQVHSWAELPGLMEGMDAVINLAGENLGSHRWTAQRKHHLWNSRLGSTSRIVDAIQNCTQKPAVLVNASAVGFYGGRGVELLDERAACGRGFLAELCQHWEASAEKAGTRLIKLRLGVVLAHDGGALPRMSLPLKCFAGTPLGDGQQGFSWIHIQDLVSLILESMMDPRYAGPINATAPHPVSNEAFLRELAHQLRRPIWPIPAFLSRNLLRLVFGEMAQEMLLQGAFVEPRRAVELGFTFRFPDPASALADLLSQRSRS